MSDDQIVLLVEDDLAHAEIVRRAMTTAGIPGRLEHVADGQAVLDYLYQRNEFCAPGRAPRPDLILLDLRMPKINGLQVLTVIKTDPRLQHIPVVVLTTSSAESDMCQAYAHHANSYLVKPSNFAQTLELMETLCRYWLFWNQPPRVCHQ